MEAWTVNPRLQCQSPSSVTEFPRRKGTDHIVFTMLSKDKLQQVKTWRSKNAYVWLLFIVYLSSLLFVYNASTKHALLLTRRLEGTFEMKRERTRVLENKPLFEINALLVNEQDQKANLNIAQNMFQVERRFFNVWGEIRSKLPERINYRKARAVIVTGADFKYFSSLKNLIGSIHYWDPLRNIVVFDLGLNPKDLEDLYTYDRVKVYPSPFRGNLKTYAWKSFCIRFATDEFGKTIWLDAGSDFRGDPKKIDDILEKEDAFFVQGQDEDMTPWSHPQTLAFFGTDKIEMKNKYSFSGNLQGYVYDSQAYWQVLKVVESCSMIKECIGPEGSNLRNHRYDQIAMSSAIYTNPTLTITPHTELLAAVREQLERNIFKESSHIVWSARRQSDDYSRYIRASGVEFDAPRLSELR